jgi:Amt family ammonium transporter
MRILTSIAVFLFLYSTGSLEAADPNGSGTYSDSVAGLRHTSNFIWILFAAFLIFYMQTGFAFLGGLLRPRYMLNYLSHCLIGPCIGVIVFWLCGFAFMFGGSHEMQELTKGNALIGYSGFLLHGSAYDVLTMLMWVFQVAAATVALTIIAGGVAERIRFLPFLIYSVIFMAFVYPVYGHWIWGGGWLQHIPFGVGAKDFAGCAAVHTIGGVFALVGAWALGPRIGKYRRDGSPNLIPGHNLSYVVIGTLLLFFGWLGYNCGSSLSATELRISVVATNSFLGGAAGTLIVLLINYATTKKIDLPLVCNGSLAGLVAITAGCAYVPTWAAIVIGIIGGLAMLGTVRLVESGLKIDDPLGATSVHAANGLWGLLALGIFADGSYQNVRGLITGSSGQMIAQLIAASSALAWALALSCAIFFGLKHTVGLRVSRNEELEGVDMSIHGHECYPVEIPRVEIERIVRMGARVPKEIEEEVDTPRS